ncbi:hypothetical protein Zmor_002227 [Zophobas morio]|uniref:Uncharacterized protein n=1 Tax=Zophobas morio TaxID=2755281 RepID=A0AA38J4E6_9CUCU|nr:hypothetical protein Zmor_002227 [Zophobas morio]
MGFHVIAGAHCVKCIKPKTCSVYGDFWELGYGRILQGNFGILGSKMGRRNKPLFNRNDIFVFWKSSHQKNASVASNKRDGLQVLQDQGLSPVVLRPVCPSQCYQYRSFFLRNNYV